MEECLGVETLALTSGAARQSGTRWISAPYFGRGVRILPLSSSRMNTSSFAGWVALAFLDS
jgi:hypothetical protein